MYTPSAVISYRCLRSVKLHHLPPPRSNTLLLWAVNINTRLTVNSPASARNVCPRAKITLPPEISQNKPIRSFIPALFYSPSPEIYELQWGVQSNICIYMLFMKQSAFALSIPPHKRWHIPRFYSTSGPFMFGSRVWMETDSSCLCSSATWSDVCVRGKRR